MDDKPAAEWEAREKNDRDRSAKNAQFPAWAPLRKEGMREGPWVGGGGHSRCPEHHLEQLLPTGPPTPNSERSSTQITSSLQPIYP